MTKCERELKMPLWGFNKDSSKTVSGANTTAGLVAGQQPRGGSHTGTGKRNVIATSAGWVRRQNKTDLNSNSRQMDETLVAANPGTASVSDGYANSAYLGFPDIVEMYTSSNSTGGNALARSATANLYVVFNEPIRHKGGLGYMRVRVANTVTGNTVIATGTAQTTTPGNIINANNTLVLSFKPGTAGTYKVNSNTIAFSSASGGTFAANLVSLNISTNGAESANLMISGAVSNNMGTFTVRSATSD